MEFWGTSYLTISLRAWLSTLENAANSPLKVFVKTLTAELDASSSTCSCITKSIQPRLTGN
jgi:hypothetical protein